MTRKIHPKITNFSRGLQTKGLEDGLPFGDFVEFLNVRVNQGVAKRRPGRAVIATATTGAKSMDFNGSTDYLEMTEDAGPWGGLGTKFTIEGLIQPDTLTGTPPIFEAGITTSPVIIDISSSKIRVRVQDSATTVTTVTSTDDDVSTSVPTSFQFTRDGADLSLRVNNGTADTGTMHATNALIDTAGVGRIGRDGAEYFDGKMDYLRLFSIVKTDHNDRLVRFPDPKVDYCLADYDFLSVAFGSMDALVKDSSRYVNHAAINGTPSAATSLCHSNTHLQLVHEYQTRGRTRKALVISGGIPYDMELQ